MIETIVNLEQAATLYNYQEYKDQICSLLEEGRVTGSVQSQDKFDATKINIARINRLDKPMELDKTLQQKLEHINTPMIWYVISEGWCGDSAQLLPYIVKMAACNAANIELKILMRDENPEIMNSYLTFGGAAVPKLIARNKTTNEDIFTWGPRPSEIVKMVLDYKEKFTLENKTEFHKNLHLWYARDKGNAIQKDFLALLT